MRTETNFGFFSFENRTYSHTRKDVLTLKHRATSVSPPIIHFGCGRRAAYTLEKKKKHFKFNYTWIQCKRSLLTESVKDIVVLQWIPRDGNMTLYAACRQFNKICVFSRFLSVCSKLVVPSSIYYVCLKICIWVCCLHPIYNPLTYIYIIYMDVYVSELWVILLHSPFQNSAVSLIYGLCTPPTPHPNPNPTNHSHFHLSGHASESSANITSCFHALFFSFSV